MKKVYTDNGMWLKDEGDNRIRLGISPWGQDEAGEISFFDPMTEDAIVKGQPFVAIEGAKAVTEVEAPFDAEILEANDRLLDHPEDLNESSDDKTWIAVVSGDNFKLEDYLTEDRPIEED